MTVAPGARIPLTVVGGYLGAGKTTLVNHLLRNAAGRRIAVLVNDFGDLAIDAALIEARTEDLISIAGGCVCCSFGSDLMGALMTLAQRVPAPQHVLIETSGVALPGAVAQSAALIPSFSIDSVTVLVDAETVRARAADRYMGDTITRQIAAADLVILNKADLAHADERQALRAWFATAAPRARVVEAARAEVPLELLFGLEPGTASATAGLLPAGRLSPGRIRPAEPATQRYESVHYSPEALDIEQLARALIRPACGLLRAKGVLRDSDGTLRTLQVVGARYEISPSRSDAAAAGLVCIGIAGQLDRAWIEAALQPSATVTQ